MVGPAVEVTPALLREWPLPAESGGKYARGQVLVVGGAANTPGAAVADRAAVALGVSVPESGVVPLPTNASGSVLGDDVEPIADRLGSADAVLVGPGLDDLDQTGLIGDVTLLSPAALAAPALVAAATATADTRTFEIGGRMVAAGPRDRVGGERLAVLGDTRLSGISAVLPEGDGDLVLGTELVGSARSVARQSGLVGALARALDRRARVVVVGVVVLVVLTPSTSTRAGGTGSGRSTSR